MLPHILAQQRTVKFDVSDRFLYLRCTVDYCGRLPAFRVTAISPKILAAAKPKQCRRHQATADLRECLYPQELLGSCQMKEEVLGRRRKVTLLQTF